MESKMFNRSFMIFLILVVTEWQLFAVQADADAERAIADLSGSEIQSWHQEVLNAKPENLVSECRKLILDHTGKEEAVVQTYTNSTNITNQILHLLYCVTMEERNEEDEADVKKEYVFGPGTKGTHVAIAKEDIGHETKYVPDKILKQDFQKWEYIYNLNLNESDLGAICKKMLAKHQPTVVISLIKPQRAVRNGVDENGSPTRFMTLLCYFDWNKYFEYCEGGNENEVFPVLYTGNGFVPILSTPVQVEYRLS